MLKVKNTSNCNSHVHWSFQRGPNLIYIYIYIFNCNWVDTRWQQYSSHLHTNSTQNTGNGTYKAITKFNVHNNKKLTNLGSAGRAPSLRVIPWHLPDNRGKARALILNVNTPTLYCHTRTVLYHQDQYELHHSYGPVVFFYVNDPIMYGYVGIASRIRPTVVFHWPRIHVFSLKAAFQVFFMKRSRMNTCVAVMMSKYMARCTRDVYIMSISECVKLSQLVRLKRWLTLFT
jgi:hypothetical protein